MIEEIKENMNRDKFLSEFACKNIDAIRFNEEVSDFRPPFFRDVDRIIYSLSYTRYIDKTQVYSECDNDNISKRMTHVQMVSKIARTIGRALKLNEDLIEAAALGHDIGHVPFGHTGEAILNKISLEAGVGYFNHNIQSVREFMIIENDGEGLNLNLQVLDAIMCHNGELELEKYEPHQKSAEQFLAEYQESFTNKDLNARLRPMTLEGCVVRISDIIAYLGRDIEDAVRLDKLKLEDIPQSITKVLGTTNKEIINVLVRDILNNSYGKNYIAMSKEVFNALTNLKKFNYEHIYKLANTQEEIQEWDKMFRKVYNASLKAIKEHDENSLINSVFLKSMSKKYLENTSDEQKAIDFIAGMTDDYLITTAKSLDI